MSGISARLRQWLVGFLAYAYKTLVLCFLFLSVIRFIFHDGAWFNDFIVFLLLSCGFALVPVFRRLRYFDKS